MKPCVLDASVAIKWYVSEVYTDQARRLLSLAEAETLEFHIPDLFLCEAGNILWKKVRSGQLEQPEAEEIARRLIAVPKVAHETRRMFSGALKLACAWGITFYDSVYVELALSLRCPLITADQRLVRALSTPGWSRFIRFLGDT